MTRTSYLVGATFCMAFALSASGADARTLRLSHNLSPDHPVHKSIQFMADRVEELTNGDLRIRIYPSAQIGEQRESLELVQNGALDLAKSNASELEAFEESYGALNLPYIFADRDHFYRVLTGDVGEDILAASRGRGFIGLTYYDSGARSFYANKPIQTPADLAGMKIRVQPSPSAIRMIELLGGSPTPLSYGELYTALQQGVVDGAENNPTALVTSRHGEVSSVFSLDEHTMIPDVLVISTQVWDGLTPEEQQFLGQAAHESMMFHKDEWARVNDEAVEQAKAEMDTTFVEVDKQAFADAVSPMHEEAAANSPRVADLIERIKALQ